MTDEIAVKLTAMLKSGATLIEARKEGIDISDFHDKNYNVYAMPEEDFPDDYFGVQYGGKYFFLLDTLNRYRRLPKRGIILKDGTIFCVDEWHMRTALWLKFNKRDQADENFVDLEGSINYIYFPESVFRPATLSCVRGYDYKKCEEKNLYKLIHEWYDLREHAVENTQITLSENQAMAIMSLCSRFDLDFERVVNNNKTFCLNDEEGSGRKVGRDNQDTINQAYRTYAKKMEAASATRG